MAEPDLSMELAQVRGALRGLASLVGEHDDRQLDTVTGWQMYCLLELIEEKVDQAYRKYGDPEAPLKVVEK